jgi:predicted Zn finger-like uncharacterized protein
MIVSCERCGARYKLDDSKVTERGAKITCPRCRHIFVVYPENVAKPATAAPSAPTPSPAAAPPPAAEKKVSAENLNFRDVGIPSWKVKVKIGLIYDFGDIKTLRKYLQEGRVTSEDVISHDGKNWKSIGEIPDLDAYFVMVYEDAKRVRYERSKNMFDDEDPTHIVGMGSLGSNMAAQALRNVSGPAGGGSSGSSGSSGSVVGPDNNADDLAAAMAAAMDAEDGGGSPGNDNPATGPQFADPFAAMRSKQRERVQTRRAPTRPTPGRAPTRPGTGRVPTRAQTQATTKASGGGSMMRSLPLVAALLLLVGGGIWYVTQDGDSAEPTASAAGPNKGVPKAAHQDNRVDLRKKLEETLDDIPQAPLDDEEEDEIDVTTLTPVVPAEFRDKQPTQPANEGFSTASNNPPPQTTGGADVSVTQNTPQSNINAGMQFMNAGDYSSAIRAFQAALSMAPGDPQASYYLGFCLYMSGSGDAAEQPLLAGQSASTQAYKYLGHIYRDRGDSAGARGYYQQYLATSPSDAAAIQAELDRLG